jgi:hypothetical protein
LIIRSDADYYDLVGTGVGLAELFAADSGASIGAGPDTALATAMPRYPSTLAVDIPRFAAIWDGLWPCCLNKWICAAWDNFTLSRAASTLFCAGATGGTVEVARATLLPG